MKIYFGEINLASTPIDSIEDTFEHQGKHYWYEMTIDEDQITLRDTCGRYMPIDSESTNDFGTALFVANNVYKAVAEGQALTDRKIAETIAIAQHFGGNGIDK